MIISLSFTQTMAVLGCLVISFSFCYYSVYLCITSFSLGLYWYKFWGAYEICNWTQINIVLHLLNTNIWLHHKLCNNIFCGTLVLHLYTFHCYFYVSSCLTYQSLYFCLYLLWFELMAQSFVFMRASCSTYDAIVIILYLYLL